MIGLIVKGPTAMFLEGSDPGPDGAVALINRCTIGNSRSVALKFEELDLCLAPRPKPLLREALDWAYVFVALTQGDERRLAPGPFDPELTGVVTAIEAEKGK